MTHMTPLTRAAGSGSAGRAAQVELWCGAAEAALSRSARAPPCRSHLHRQIACDLL